MGLSLFAFLLGILAAPYPHVRKRNDVFTFILYVCMYVSISVNSQEHT